ncbi:hypothetical protein C8R43DRAFT_997665 [Mycena crocata]|nr:hypothetical protein C8R43DRAFT_997665 [Mycena crocata]
MTALTTTDLLALPAEVLLMILDPLSPTRRIDKQNSVISCSSRDIRSLSLVCRRLRQLCITRLFCSLRCTDAHQLMLLSAKCTQDSYFARLIRKLDIMDVASPDILPSLLSHLESLEWLDLDAEQLDAGLLATVNTYPNLTTVAVRDLPLDDLEDLSSSASLSLSKILVPSAVSSCSFPLQCPALQSLMSRSPRLTHLILRGEVNILCGAGTLSLPGLEKLDIKVYRRPTYPMSWLSGFVDRHPSLKTISFLGDSSLWRRNPDILFPLQFIDAMESKGLTDASALDAFSLFRSRAALSLDDWEVTELQITIVTAAGVSALTIASSLAPHLSSLVIRMSRYGSQGICINHLISTLASLSCLRVLSLHGTFRHLREPVSHESPHSKPLRKTSTCIVAHAALRSVISRLVQSTLSLDIIHITDEGNDVERPYRFPWSLKATYLVSAYRKPEVDGTPELFMNERYKEQCRDAPTPASVRSARLPIAAATLTTEPILSVP